MSAAARARATLARWRAAGAARALAAYLAHFSLAKGLSFAAPIAFGLYIQESVYGALEFALAAAPVAALALTAGAPAATMQLMLMRSARPVLDVLAAATGGCAALATLALAPLALAQAPGYLAVATPMVALFGLQLAALAYARASSWRFANLWIEHIPSLFLVGVALGLAAFGRLDRVEGFVAALAVAAFGVAIGGAVLLRRTLQPDLAGRLAEAARVGLPIVAATLAGAWITASGRVFLQIANMEDALFAYAFTFRIASLVALANALAIGAFAAELYKMPTRRFDRVATLMIVILFLATVAYLALSPEQAVAGLVSPRKQAVLASQPAIKFVAVQVFFWAAGALVDMRIARARLAGRATRAIMAISLAGVALAATMWTNGPPGPAAVMLALAAQQGAAVAAGHILLARRGIPLRRTACATGVGGFLLLALAALAP